MAKNKNKGFTVVEIVIAIAILTLLLTPIVEQLSQTMRTNRIAKEQQYANENAQYVLEYFQNTSMDVLADTTDTTRDIYATNTVAAQTMMCDIYEVDDAGNISAVPVGSVEYSVYEYELNSVELGSRNTEYTRTAYLDDLALQIMSTPLGNDDNSDGESDYSYRVAYDMAEESGYTLTNEGSLVQYDSTETYITAIVCKKVGKFDGADGKGIKNPNEINLGNVHDLDSSKVALITGNATDCDTQAENEFYSMTMNYLKEKDPVTYQDAMNAGNDKDHNPLFTTADYIQSTGKMTELVIKEDTSGTKPYYLVQVNVYYENGYLKSKGQPYKIEYNAFSQKFYYETGKPHACPDVYFEYQPYATDYSSGSSTFQYAQNEYILVNNQVEGAKVYLYKPKWDMSYRYMNPTGAYDDETLIMASHDVYYQLTRVTDLQHTIDKTKVKIHINDENDPAATTYKQLTIYTNLPIDSINGSDSQFISNDTTKYASSFTITENGSEKMRMVYGFDSDYIKGIDDEDNLENRLYTVSVHLEPVSATANTIVLNGAKGEN